MRITDPEGTDISYTLWDEYFDESRPMFTRDPVLGHLMAHPEPPILAQEDSTGTIAGTTSHYSRPFPHIKAYFEKGLMTKIEGGGKYGEAWRGFLEETKNVQYPEYPRPGLFWLWEIAIGTNPQVVRPKSFLRVSSGGTESERFRSGIIHMGIGTSWRAASEVWAAENGILFGHLHIHLLFPTLEITTKDGERIKMIDKGHLSVLEDPEVVKLASKFGDPNKLLKEAWVPALPGINTNGDYWNDYAKDPASWIAKELQEY